MRATEIHDTLAQADVLTRRLVTMLKPILKRFTPDWGYGHQLELRPDGPEKLSAMLKVFTRSSETYSFHFTLPIEHCWIESELDTEVLAAWILNNLPECFYDVDAYYVSWEGDAQVLDAPWLEKPIPWECE